jgi:Trk K+ transport system NAD-binding subunit
MRKKIILIIGAGHLAYRLKKHFAEKPYNVLHTTIDAINNATESISLIENIGVFFSEINIDDLAMVYLLEDKDENNLQLIIALISSYKNLPITASLFNENLIPHLQAANNLTILNPARIAAPSFVAMLYKEISAEPVFTSNSFFNKKEQKKPFSLIQKLILFFALFLLAATSFFHYYEGLSWIDAVYFVVVTAASVGYGDINLAQSSAISKAADILLILVSTISIWMIFSLTIDSLLRKRIQLSLGRKQYHFKNHVIVCGLGRLSFFIVQELIQKNEKVIIIEQNENANHIDYFRQMGAEVYIGDGRLAKVLNDVNVKDAKVLISVINNDALNLEIGLNARSLDPTMRLILRIFDELMALKINEYLKFHLTLSVSAIADEKFYEVLKNTNE